MRDSAGIKTGMSDAGGAWPARIAFVIHRIGGRAGGAERVLVETANEMARRGFRVDILSYENDAREPFYPLARGVTHTNLFNVPTTRREARKAKRRERIRKAIPRILPFSIWKWGMWNVGFVRGVRNHLTAAAVEVAIPFMPPAMVASAIASMGLGVGVLASTHNAPEQDFQNPKRWDPNHVDVWLRYKTLKLMTGILVLLPVYIEWYPESLRSKMRVIPNPIQPIPDRLLGAAMRRKVVVSVGRLASVKRHDLLIECWSDLRRDFPDWELRIFGDGPRRLSLAELVRGLDLEDCVKLMGTTSRIQDEYLSASLLCHPAEYEGFPLVVGEALAAGLPVVGFADCSGLNHLVKDGTNGLLVAPSDRRRMLAQALRTLMSDETARRRMAAAAPGTVAEYAPTSIYDQWEAVIMEAIPARPWPTAAPQGKQPVGTGKAV